MQKLIPIINKLQDVFNSVGIRQSKVDLPQIAVVGSQSAGKSSVLEAIVGHDFLPRGNDIVTRRPLVLQLIHTTDGRPMRAELLDQLLESQKPPVPYNKRLNTYEEIRDSIAFVTEQACPKKMCVPNPIRLKIFSPEVIDLTLVDLPGLTKNPVAGQPANIATIIKKMVMQYITRKNCILLAISAANVDIANSDAIRMSKLVDPAGDRTLGVLTKIDIMDRGTDAMEVLTGRVLPLKKGFVGVVNRSQADIAAKKPIEAALRDEKRFFLSHPKYRHIAQRQGVGFLSQRLNSILLNHIRSVLPELREKIDNLLAHARDRLVQFGPALEEGMGLKGHLLSMITQFSTEFVDCIEGRNVDETQELFGGACINHIFFRKFIPALHQMDPTKNLSDYDIKLRIQLSKGTRSSLYIPESAFETLVKIQVKRLELPALRCVDQVFQELVGIVDHAAKPLMRFPALKERVRGFSVDLLRQYTGPLKDFLRNLIACELAYVNTMHPDFFGGGTKVLLLMEKIRTSSQGPTPPKGQLPNPPERGGRLFGGRGEDPASASAAPPGRAPRQPSSQVSRTKTDPEEVSFREPCPPPPPPAPVVGQKRPFPPQHRKSQRPRVDVPKKKKKKTDDWVVIRKLPSSGAPKREKKRSFFSALLHRKKKNIPQLVSVSSRRRVAPPPKPESPEDEEEEEEEYSEESEYEEESEFEEEEEDPEPHVEVEEMNVVEDLIPTEDDSRPSFARQRAGGDEDVYQYRFDRSAGRASATPPPASAPAHVPAPRARPLDRERMEVEVIRTLLGQYFDIVRKQIGDRVPKCIMHFLVNMSCKNLHAELIRGLYTEASPEDILREDESIKQKRKATRKMLNILLQAQEILNEVRDIEL